MTRGDPERIYQAQRAGTFRRLVDAERVDVIEAEHLLSSWAREAEAIGLTSRSARYWDDAWTWIAVPRSARNG